MSGTGNVMGVGLEDSSSSPAAGIFSYCLGSVSRPGDVARQLFKALRDADDAGVDAIVVEGLENSREGMAVMNRLRKAATHLVSL
jgi:L-threonylcarbamoyladenylate synthase